MEPTIGEHLARIRCAKSLTQEQLAEQAGVSVDTIRKLEQGVRSSARIATLHRLARALGVPTTALMGDASTAAARAEPDHRPLSLAEIRVVAQDVDAHAASRAEEHPGEPSAPVQPGASPVRLTAGGHPSA